MTSFTEPSGSLGKADIVERGWLHETHPGLWYRWVIPGQLLRNDEYGIEITYRPSRPGDVICGVRTIEPGIPGLTNYGGMDLSVDHEVLCTFVGDHGEAPHIGVVVECLCEDPVSPDPCPQDGADHVVSIGFAIRPGERTNRQERTTS